MPTYTYQCQNCGNTTMKLVSVQKRDNPDIKCPYCKESTLKRMIDKPAGFKIENGGTIGKTPPKPSSKGESSCASGACNL